MLQCPGFPGELPDTLDRRRITTVQSHGYTVREQIFIIIFSQLIRQLNDFAMFVGFIHKFRRNRAIIMDIRQYNGEIVVQFLFQCRDRLVNSFLHHMGSVDPPQQGILTGIRGPDPPDPVIQGLCLLRHRRGTFRLVLRMMRIAPGRMKGRQAGRNTAQEFLLLCVI